MLGFKRFVHRFYLFFQFRCCFGLFNFVLGCELKLRGSERAQTLQSFINARVISGENFRATLHKSFPVLFHKTFKVFIIKVSAGSPHETAFGRFFPLDFELIAPTLVPAASYVLHHFLSTDIHDLRQPDFRLNIETFKIHI